MRVVKLCPPVNADPPIPARDAEGNHYLLESLGAGYSGKAVGANGLEYTFMGADLTPGSVCAFRQPHIGAYGYEQVRAPSALIVVVRKAIRAATQ
jgi:hypothetical protein